MEATLTLEERVAIAIATISFDYRMLSQVDEIVLDKNSNIRRLQNYASFCQDFCMIRLAPQLLSSSL